MSQLIVFDYPPNMNDIDAVFHTRGKPVLYTYGHRIYNPLSMTIPPALTVHEAIHGMRQADHMTDITNIKVDLEVSVIEWWRKYLVDPHFRLIEEVLAHREEFKWHCRQPLMNRQKRRARLTKISRRLSGPLYNGLVTHKQAARMLLLSDADLLAHILKGKSNGSG